MIEVRELTKTYHKNGAEIRALDGVSFSLAQGGFAILHGASGSGKSTLLLTLGGMLSPTSGTVRVEGADLYAMSRARRNAFRRSAVGFIFQKFHLMPYLTVYDNIRLPLALRGSETGVQARIHAVAERLGIAGRLDHLPGELSVGEQQRAAAARTLVSEPKIILADEPTGNLDRANRELIAQALLEENRRGRTILVATHEESLLSLGSRRFELIAGRINASQQS